MLTELPIEIRNIEGHLLWLENIVYSLRDSKGDSYVERTLRNKDLHIESEEELCHLFDDCSSDNPKYAGFFAMLLNVASKSAYLGELKKAKQVLQTVDKFSERIQNSEHKRILKGIKYCIDAVKWSTTFLENSNGIQGDEFLEISAQAQNEWTSIQNDNVTLATIEFFKGSLAKSLRMSSNEVSNHFRKAIELDPEYPMWYHYLYRKLRDGRRNERASDSNQLNLNQTQEERDVCELAYKLCETSSGSNKLLHLLDFALAIKDGLLVRDKDNICISWNDEKEKEYQNLLELLSEGLNTAKDHGHSKWISKLTVMKAEVLLYVKPNDFDTQEQGKQLLFECLEQFPSDTSVHHKVGKLFQQEAALDITQVWRLRKAQQHFAKALTLDPSNFGCLMDYMKLINDVPDRHYDDYRETLGLIRKGIEVVKNDYQAAELYFLQGCVLWIHNPELSDDNKRFACESWLFVVKHLPAHLDHLMKGIVKPPFKISYGKWRREPVIINFKKIMAELTQLRVEYSKILNMESVKAVDIFYNEVNKRLIAYCAGELETPRSSEAHRTTLTNSSLNSQSRTVGFGNRIQLKSYNSLADMDGDWRSEKR